MAQQWAPSASGADVIPSPRFSSPPTARYNRLYTEPNAGLLHPYSMVTASRNNSQLESGFMNKWSIPRRPHFPRFGPFS